jgi:hypothetical protein
MNLASANSGCEMPAPKLARDRCRCAVCGLSFASTWSFDSHRAGPYTDRRCLTKKQLKQKANWSISNGFWRLPG